MKEFSADFTPHEASKGRKPAVLVTWEIDFGNPSGFSGPFEIDQGEDIILGHEVVTPHSSVLHPNLVERVYIPQVVESLPPLG